MNNNESSALTYLQNRHPGQIVTLEGTCHGSATKFNYRLGAGKIQTVELSGYLSLQTPVNDPAGRFNEWSKGVFGVCG